MAIRKCKTCGEPPEFESGAKAGVCNRCGTKQPLPRLNDDGKANPYNGEGGFRRDDDFDKAAVINEQIPREDKTDAAAAGSVLGKAFPVPEDEQACREAEKVISAFEAKRLDPAGQTVTRAKKRRDELQRLCGNYRSIEAQIAAVRSEAAGHKKTLDAMRAQRSSPGLFAGKKKKRLDGEIAALQRKTETLEQDAENRKARLGGFASEAEAQEALKKQIEVVAALDKKISEFEKNQTDAYSYGKALKVYSGNAAVRAIVDKKGYAPETITFGNYPSDKDHSTNPIEWKILDVKDGKALLISEYALDSKPYHTSYTDVTWETCSLREWLNSTFINAAFSTEEQNRIIRTTVTTEKNDLYGTPPGNDTIDRIFLLSIEEAYKYFGCGYLVSDKARRCAPTDYAAAQGAGLSDEYKTDGRATCRWWLRSPGEYSTNAAAVGDDGEILDYGEIVHDDCFTVRPALWIDLES